MPTPREELNRLRRLAVQQETVLSPRQELNRLRALAKQGEQDVRSTVADTAGLSSVQDDVGAGADRRDSGGIGESIGAVLEPAATMLTGALAEPAAGIAGIFGAAGARSPEDASRAGAEAVEATREALTYKPKTEAGKKGLQAVGEVLKPVGEALKSAETFLGDETFEATKSPALAAAATTIPTALIEGLGLASARGVIKAGSRTKQAAKSREVRRAVVEAAPDIDQIKDASRAVYKELDNSGVAVKSVAMKSLVKKIEKKLQKEGLDRDLTPDSFALVRRLNEEIGKKSLSDVDTIRQVAQSAADATKLSDARLGAIAIDEIDSFLDSASPSSFIKGNVPTSEIGPKYKVARALWGRARRSEIINEAFEKASLQASGFENGLVVQFRQILANPKRRRFFKAEEINAMKDVVKGTTTANIAKLVGRFGFSEGHATNIVGGAIGSAAGATAFGPVGGVVIPAIGQVSRKLAQKLTLRGAKFADAVIRAGDNAEDIARAYLSNVNKAARSAEELSELLVRSDLSLDAAIASNNKLIREAAEIAKGRRALNAAAGITAAGTPGAIKEREAD